MTNFDHFMTGQGGRIELVAQALIFGRAVESDVVVPDRLISRRQVELRREGDVWIVVPLSTSVPTIVDGQSIDAAHRLSSGESIEFGAHRYIYHREPATRKAPPVPAIRPGQEAESQATANSPDTSGLSGTLVNARGLGDFASAEQRRLWVRRSGTLGREPGCVYRLDHPMVSARHLEVIVEGRRVGLRDAGSTNGTFVNGERLEDFRALSGDEQIDVGPFTLEFTGDAFLVATRRGNARLVARNLVRSIGERRILDDVSIVIEPSEFVALIGPSGSGKSTLLGALSARAPADEGHVTLNGVPLYEGFESLKRGIAMIPQREVLHESLTLGEALDYTARLRLPRDTPDSEREGAIERALREVELQDHANTRIGDLSGGQRKRAALANETLCEPQLCFADEVTSGLDEETDREIMGLFRRQADGGMTVIAVTHTMANVEEYCHKVAILTVGGKLAFYGTPAEALAHFGVDRLGRIYDLLKQESSDVLERRYVDSDFRREHIGEPLQRDRARRRVVLPARDARSTWRRDVDDLRGQVRVLTARAMQLLSSDRQALTISFGQSVLVALVLAAVFAGIEDQPHPLQVELERSLLFLVGVSCFWFGCNNASKEIVKERAIYACERDVNLSVPGYVVAKLAGLAVLGGAQVALLVVLLESLISVPGPVSVQAVVMGVTMIAGSCLGLLVSAAAKSPDQATIAVPILLIPQIVMAGRIVEDMPALADGLARAAVSGFWVFRGMDEALAAGGWNAATGASLAILAFHAGLCLAGALFVLVQRDRRGEGVYGAAISSWMRDRAARLAVPAGAVGRSGRDSAETACDP